MNKNQTVKDNINKKASPKIKDHPSLSKKHKTDYLQNAEEPFRVGANKNIIRKGNNQSTDNKSDGNVNSHAVVNSDETTGDKLNIVQQFRSNGHQNLKETTTTASQYTSQLMELFEDGLKKMYGVEKTLAQVIPKLIQHVTSEELIESISIHMEETRDQIERLAKVFTCIGKKPATSKSEAIDGLIKEVEYLVESYKSGAMCDASIIAALQKIEHYEISSYGTLRQFATTLNIKDAARLLAISLEEEYTADEIFSEIAIHVVNVEAAETEA